MTTVTAGANAGVDGPGEAGSETSRRPNYRSLKNPFLPQPIFLH